MTRPVPATPWLPARTADERSAYTIEEQPDRAARRFAFRAARQAERRTFSRRSTDQHQGKTHPTIDHHDPQNSSRFLAGAIAQARPGVTLHHPRHRDAAGAYRRSDDLGEGRFRLGFRSDTRV